MLTPDEEHIHRLRSEQGRQQLDMLQAYAALSKVPDLDLKDFREAMWLLDQTLDPLKRPRIDGEIVCADGPSNPAGTKFCGECGMRMDAKAVIQVGRRACPTGATRTRSSTGSRPRKGAVSAEGPGCANAAAE